MCTRSPFLKIKSLLIAALTGLILPCLTQTPANVPSSADPPPQRQHQDVPTPEPHPDLKPLVDAIRNLLNEGKYADALQQAKALLQQATEKSDKIGQAYAHRFRALALQGQNRLDEALPAWEQAERLWREIGDGAFLVEALMSRALHWWRTNRQQAEMLVAEVLEIAKTETQRPLATAAMLRRAGVDWLSRDTSLMMTQKCYHHSYELYKRYAPNSLGMAEILISVGALASDMQEYADAEKYLRQALELLTRIGESNSLEAGRAWFNLGVTFRGRGDLVKSKEYFIVSLQIYEKQRELLRAARTLDELSRISASLGEWTEANEFYQKAEALYKELGMYVEAFRTRSNRGVSAFRRGDHNLALKHFLEVVEFQLQHAPCDAALTLNRIGSTYGELGDLQSSVEYLRHALEIYQQHDCHPYQRAIARMDLAITLAEQGNLSEARKELEQVRSLLETLDGELPTVALCWVNLGVLAFREGNYEEAQRCYERAETIYKSLQTAPLLIDLLYHNMAVAAATREDWELAEQYSQKALELRKRFSPRSIFVANTLTILASFAFRRNQLEQAKGYLQEAIRIIEEQRQTVVESETRSLFAERYFDAYTLLALTYAGASQPAQAAETLERSRARSLAETLRQRQLAFAENTPKPLRQFLQQQQQLNAKRQQTYRQLQQTDPKDADTIAQLQRILRELDQQQRMLDDRLRKEFPDYANLVLPKPLSIQQIQQSLDAGTVLLYHALTEDHLLIVAVSRTQVQGVARKVDGRRLEQQVQQLRVALSKPLALRDAVERREWQAWSQQLYAQLVAPVQGMLQNAQRVLLCPDGVLSQLPWAALIVKTENGKPVYWMERVALHITPSIGVYRQARSVQPVSQGAAIAAVWNYTNGKPIDLAQNRRLEVAMVMRRSGAGTVLEDLPHAPDEVAALRKVFGGAARVVENAQATPQKAKQLAQEARVVHFVCHARADNADPLGSALLLAPAGSDVGLLRAGEVLLNWRLRADLVMLSACETGLGAARRYEGVYSLGRAFLVAGSRSVGMSLWEVSDEATVELMKGFYTRYTQGVAKDAALREAQLELLRNPKYADPFFWSAFVLMGDYRQAGASPPKSFAQHPSARAANGQTPSQNRSATATKRQNQK